MILVRRWATNFISHGRTRRHGGGRKPLTEHDPDLYRALEVLVDPATRGDPMSPLRCTCKSAAKLATELQAEGHGVSERTVHRLLDASGYSLQSNRETIECGDLPDRDDRFPHAEAQERALGECACMGEWDRYRAGRWWRDADRPT